MSTEDLIVEVVQFISTKQCAADPSLSEAVRNIVQRWQNKGMKGQYWGKVEGRPNNIYWIIFWQSRAHAAAFAADPSYPEFVRRRESLATTSVRDLHVPVSGAPEPCIEAPVTEVDFFTTHDTSKEETHAAARTSIHHLRSLKPAGFHGSSHGVTLEDPTVGLYIAGWNAVEDHMRVGMVEGHEKFREIAEELMNGLSDLVIAHVAFKKHGT